MKTVGVIGYGNMGSALCRGLADRGFALAVAEKKPDRVAALKTECGLESVAPAAIFEKSDVVILAVKPQELAGLIPELAPSARGKKFISIIAGKPIAFFASGLGTDQVCRFMPNLAAQAGKAAVAVSFHEKASADFKKDCLAVASAIGEAFVLPENLIAAFTGLSGSGIAYVFAFAHAMALGGVAAGIRYEEAVKIARSTLEGAAATLAAGGENPVTLLSRVISPAGTTIEGVKRLEEEGFTAAVMRAVEAAARRAAELEK